MATITLSLASTTFTGSKVYTLSDADVDRWLAALRIYFKEIKPTPSNAQLLALWANEVIGGVKRQVIKTETEAAVAAIVPVSTS